MPSHSTFSIKPIMKLINKYYNADMLCLNPFAFTSNIGITNDVNPNLDTDYNLDATEFLSLWSDESVDMVLYDPPYTPSQLKEHYDELKMQKRIIHMFDANEMISQILLNINIPLNSKGFPINLFNDSMNHFIALKAKEIQLIQKIEKYVKKYPIFESELNDLLIGLKDDFLKYY